MSVAIEQTLKRARFTGWHMTAILTAFFGVVIVVNVYMAHLATSTFTGLVVENSYVASQNFNKWLDEANQERALGWQAKVTRQLDGRVAVALSGTNVDKAVLTAEAWHPLGLLADRNLSFRQVSAGQYISEQALPDGRWRLRLAAVANGHKWRINLAL